MFSGLMGFLKALYICTTVFKLVFICTIVTCNDAHQVDYGQGVAVIQYTLPMLWVVIK